MELKSNSPTAGLHPHVHPLDVLIKHQVSASINTYINSTLVLIYTQTSIKLVLITIVMLTDTDMQIKLLWRKKMCEQNC